MADLIYQATLDDKISPALARIQNQVGQTSAAFGKLKSALAGLAIGAAIQGALKYADAIQDISDATGIATENILGFSKAVQANGGDSDKAQQALLRFSQTIGEAASGSLTAQQAFASIGVTLQDLATLSEADLLRKTIDGLDKVGDNSKRAAIQADIFGKTLRGVNLPGVANSYGAMTAASAKYAEQIRRAAELQDKLDAAVGQFKLSLLSALEPLINFVNNLSPEQINRFVDAMVKIGGSAVAIAGLAKAVEGLSKVLGIMTGAVTLGAAAMVSLGKTWYLMGWQLAKGIVAFQAASGVIAKLGQLWITVSTFFAKRLVFLVAGVAKLAAAFAAVALAVVGINELIKLAFDVDPIDAMATKLEELVTKYLPWLASGINAIGRAFGMAPSPGEKKATAEGPPKSAMITDAQAKELEKTERQIQDALARQRKEIELISEEFANQLGDRAEQLQFETAMVGKSEQQRELYQQIFDLNKKTNDEVDKLVKARDLLATDPKNAQLVELYDQQIAKVKSLSAAETERLTKLVELNNAAKSAEQLRLYNLQQEYDLQDKLSAIERQRADLTLTDIQKGYKDIMYAADDAAKAAIRAEEARRGSPLSAQEVEAYYKKARDGAQRLLKEQEKLNRQSRDFSTGWKKAFNQYVENARDAASAAQRAFDKFTQGLEDLIVDFAKTGKFEWKNFVASLTEELLRSQIKMLLADIMTIKNPFSGSGGTIGDLFGGIFGSLLGGNELGSTPNNAMWVRSIDGALGGGGSILGPTGPGQQGGGIMDTIGNVFTGVKNAVGGVINGAGNVLGSIGSGIGSVVGGIADTVGGIFSGGGDSGGGSWLSDIGDSIGDMFGGFFANGGVIPAGKFGVVGERGPEFVGGPASVSPMGGSQSVTYNINAVDAQSFKALIASDPGFIHAVAMKGAGSIPMGR